jgi:hypothetical protein
MEPFILNLLQYLDAGGTIVLFFVVLIMWRTDRRILKLELAIYNGLHGKLNDLKEQLTEHVGKQGGDH